MSSTFSSAWSRRFSMADCLWKGHFPPPTPPDFFVLRCLTTLSPSWPSLTLFGSLFLCISRQRSLTSALPPRPFTDSLMHMMFLEARETRRTLSENGLFWISFTNCDSCEWVREQ